jgi:GT2 family glycosyltransferase/glycosyltransferase involved in cell wall biosynthesis
MIDVSIIIPVLDKLAFTRQCVDRIGRHTESAISYEVIVVDNASSDGTAAWCAEAERGPTPVRCHRNAQNLGYAKSNNLGARLAAGTHLLFLNNDTLVQPGWLSGMLRVRRSDASVGVVGIKQLFPYTNTIYHTGIVFGADARPQHLYPHLDASLAHVNKEREYQAVTGACLLIDRSLFEECGGFDEAYLNGYEDVDLCLAVRQRGRKVVCCTSAYIYHYGQISEGRTDDDERNAAVFAKKWAGQVRPDLDDYLIRDRAASSQPVSRPAVSPIRHLADDCIYLADALDQGSALTWINADLAVALNGQGIPVFINGEAALSPTLPAATRRLLKPLAMAERPIGGVQVKWSHYWPRHLNLELAGDVNLEWFVINYFFGRTDAEPWDFWLQSLRHDGHHKLPLSDFCQSVLLQLGVPQGDCHVWSPGYSPEIGDVEAPTRGSSRYRFLTITNSHDLERYNTAAILEAYQRVFGPDEDVTLVIKDYGASSGDRTLRSRLAERASGPSIEYVSEFTDKSELIRLYKSCDAFVSAHRGEGFGMKILDAMACGLPVVAPLFGGPTNYCTPDTCFPVEFHVVPMGPCLDARSLPITNQPMWAEVSPQSLGEQMRRVHQDRDAAAALGARARTTVLERFSWDSAARKLVEIAGERRAGRRKAARVSVGTTQPRVERSPYWLGLRVSVVVPTHNRKEKLMACLDALARQSILPQEFEVVVVDDGSTDGTGEAVRSRDFPFAIRYCRQEGGGPGTARNLGIEQAAGELVLFIGDDILADERLLEAHLLAHAVNPAQGAAVLGHIDWPDAMQPNAVMDYVCGDAMLQFAYTLIPTLPALDHRFFYTSNISLKRQFLTDAAEVGIGFDPRFRHAAFEDSELAFRLMPRGLQIVYAESARARHDHWMDLDSFADREFRAGQMAVVFYRKHPGHDDQLQVRWIADLVEPAAALMDQPDLLRHVEAFDVQTDTLFRSLAASIEELLAMSRRPGPIATLSPDRLRAGLGSVLKVIFDVQRTRGKVQEWFSTVDDPAKAAAAQSLAGLLRKIEFFDRGGAAALPGPLGFDNPVTTTLKERLNALAAAPAAATKRGPIRQRIRQVLRRLAGNPVVFQRLLAADRQIQARLRAPARRAWLERYQRIRSRIRRVL